MDEVEEMDKYKRKWVKGTEVDKFESPSLQERLFKAHTDRVRACEDNKGVVNCTPKPKARNYKTKGD